MRRRAECSDHRWNLIRAVGYASFSFATLHSSCYFQLGETWKIENLPVKTAMRKDGVNGRKDQIEYVLGYVQINFLLLIPQSFKTYVSTYKKDSNRDDPKRRVGEKQESEARD